MIYYAVIDTNVIISAMLNPDSIPGTVVKYALAGLIVPFLNDEIIKEYNDVANRDKFSFSKEDINFVLSSLKEKGMMVERTETLELFIDKKDIVFYEITLTAREMYNAFLVTGNIKHFPKKHFVVTPKEIVDIINNQ